MCWIIGVDTSSEERVVSGPPRFGLDAKVVYLFGLCNLPFTHVS